MTKAQGMIAKGITVGVVVLWPMFGCTSSSGADGSLSSRAQELKSSLIALKKKPKDKSAQLRYLEKFPKDMVTFKLLFDPPDFSELYDGKDYIFVLSELAQDQPGSVGELLITLSKDAHQGADALSYLQQVTAEFGVKNTAAFAKLLHSHSEKEVTKVIRYLADVENHYSYPEYPMIVENLRKLGEAALARQFEVAKKERMQQPAHGKLRDEPTPAGGI